MAGPLLGNEKAKHGIAWHSCSLSAVCQDLSSVPVNQNSWMEKPMDFRSNCNQSVCNLPCNPASLWSMCYITHHLSNVDLDPWRLPNIRGPQLTSLMGKYGKMYEYVLVKCAWTKGTRLLHGGCFPMFCVFFLKDFRLDLENISDSKNSESQSITSQVAVPLLSASSSENSTSGFLRWWKWMPPCHIWKYHQKTGCSKQSSF